MTKQFFCYEVSLSVRLCARVCVSMCVCVCVIFCSYSPLFVLNSYLFIALCGITGLKMPLHPVLKVKATVSHSIKYPIMRCTHWGFFFKENMDLIFGLLLQTFLLFPLLSQTKYPFKKNKVNSF